MYLGRGDRGSEGTGAQNPHTPDAGSPASMCQRDVQGPARPLSVGSFILHPGLPHPRAPAAPKGGSGTEWPGWATALSPEPRPRRNSRAPAASTPGWSGRPRRPAPDRSPGAPPPHPPPAWARPLRPAARLPRSPYPHRPAAAGSRPSAPSPAPDFPRPDPLCAAAGLSWRAAGRTTQ
jgi:hypothetical protein